MDEGLKMHKIIDQTNDAGHALLRVVLDEYPHMREMTKEAELGVQELSDLPDHAFAWPGRRQFPIHNREHAFISYGYSKHASALPSDVTERLDTAVDAYDIDTSAFEAPLQLEKEASNEEWLLPEKSRFRIKEAADVGYAEEALHSRYNELDIADRATAMRNLVKVAARYAVELRPLTHKLGSFTMTSTRRLQDYVAARCSVATKLGSEVAPAYSMLEKELQKRDPYIAETVEQVKVARLLEGLDKQSGVDAYYAKGVPDPLRSVFNTEKLASEQVQINGEFFDKTLLGGIPVTFWKDALGDDVVSEITTDGEVSPDKLSEVIMTLPQDVKTTLVTQLKPYKK